MFREMRRQDRKMDNNEIIEVLKKCQYGVLSTVGIDGYAYGVPLSYVYLNNSIYFHCATVGHKLDNIRNNDKVSFCIVGEVDPVPEKFTTKYKSVILFGKASEVNGDEKYLVLIAILEKYAGQCMDKGKEYIKSAGEKVKVIKISIDYIEGKTNR
ncbi:pyridoxamine 5'-phosphate oxidase family protein [Thermoanaerobacterium thermosaccharolyticum]|uniref:pyridoxamine 5'-phosphate oxidase family protein n=1 Tax=Thermoanaerobacterium thermosaccharolyticum TaxID=1517 RepID=UPI003D286F91